ncbi:hypothetical protein B0H67DRAFT_137528 [Lasiosphaeris hirsuta]|uniref:Uncharacterized protein n=1 Tax=Lasiosphaeris hirsuta TaxID=260670 RepID=A0AA40E3H9_9PEZI|nr:hypothetical protein B0H67DRAFT_137528 [Lasiosphaeris hirsuta]
MHSGLDREGFRHFTGLGSEVLWVLGEDDKGVFVRMVWVEGETDSGFRFAAAFWKTSTNASRHSQGGLAGSSKARRNPTRQEAPSKVLCDDHQVVVWAWPWAQGAPSRRPYAPCHGHAIAIEGTPRTEPLCPSFLVSVSRVLPHAMRAAVLHSFRVDVHMDGCLQVLSCLSHLQTAFWRILFPVVYMVSSNPTGFLSAKH